MLNNIVENRGSAAEGSSRFRASSPVAKRDGQSFPGSPPLFMITRILNPAEKKDRAPSP